VKAYKDELESFHAKLRRYLATFDHLVACIGTPGCSLLDLAKRQNKAIWEWLRSLGDEKLPANIQRVQKANSLLRNYATDLEGSVEGNINSAVSCLSDYQQRAQQSADAVDLRKQPTSQPPTQTKPKSGSGAKSGGGMSPSTTVALAAAGAGLAVAGVGLAQQAAKEAEAAKCDAQETAMMNTMTAMENAANNLAACGGSMTCYNSRLPALQSAWQTAASAAGNYCTCAGAQYQLSASEKEAVQWMWSAAAQMGWNPGTLPSCFK
jgi:hypothetical protein